MKVTAHATIRWLERIEGMDLTEPKAEMRKLGLDHKAPGEVLKYLWSAYGISAYGISAKILTPLVVKALEVGIKTIRTDEAIIVVHNGAVVSVLSPTMKTSRVRPPKRRIDDHDRKRPSRSTIQV